MKYIILLLTISIYPFAIAGGQQPITAIFPMQQIYEGTEVFIGYDPLRLPCLERLVNFQGLDSYFEIDNNNIDITVSALGFVPCPDLSSPYNQFEKYSLGHLPKGSYSIQMYWVHPGRPLPVPPEIQRAPLGGTVQFDVLGVITVPTLNFFPLFLLGVIICFSTLLILRKRSLR